MPPTRVLLTDKQSELIQVSFEVDKRAQQTRIVQWLLWTLIVLHLITIVLLIVLR